MSRFDAQAIAEMVTMVEEMLAKAGFTGVKLESAPMSAHVIKGFQEEDPEEDFSDPVAFGQEVGYHRITTDQGVFGIWFEPYVTVDIGGLGIDAKVFLPEDAPADDMPDGWCLIGLDEGVLEKLFIEIIKKSRQP